MKHSVYTTHVGPRLHRHRLVHTRTHIHTRAHAPVSRIRTQAHTYTGWLESSVGRRESHSINTPRCLHPQERRCTPSTPPPLSLSLSPFLSHPPSLSLLSFSPLYPPTTPLHRGRRVRPPLEKRDDTVETGFRPAEDSARKILGSAEFFDTRSWTM